MLRIADALTLYAPSSIKITTDESSADLVIMYVIGVDANKRALRLTENRQRYAVVQCCLQSAGYFSLLDAFDLWNNAAIVWSYYDMSQYAEQSRADFVFYYAPLGVNSETFYPIVDNVKCRGVLTSGYVTGSSAEAIEEVWQAALVCGLECEHIGPSILEGTEWEPTHVHCHENISDTDLNRLYNQCHWTASLRHVEGFELPAAEGLMCNTRPILFDQPALRHWYGDHAVFIRECSGEGLVYQLVDVFKNAGSIVQVLDIERSNIKRKFDWGAICTGFWTTLLRSGQ